MATRADELKDLAINIKTAMEKTRRLSLPTSTYILSMALLEVGQALKAAVDNEEDDATS